MTLIDCIEISKQFGTKRILENVNFSAKSGEKIALIGKNGAGKSTLLALLLGSLQPDSGRIIRAKGASCAHLAQQLEGDLSLSLNDYLRAQLDRHFAALNELTECNEALAKEPNNAALLARASALSDEIDSLDAWDIERKMQRALAELNLLTLQNRSLASLSGGEQRRVNLCAMLLLNPEIMILDEPTNHLDLAMCEYLISMLRASKKCIITVSHDRYLIDAIASRCVELENAQLLSFTGGYANYLERKMQLLQSAQKAHEVLLKQLKSEEEWLRRGVKARLKRNEGRKERIMQMRQAAKKNPSVLNNLRLELARALPKSQTAAPGSNRKKMLFELENISLKIGERTLFSGFSARILQGEKIAIVGRNGSGKSSFLRMLLGDLEPASGKIRRAQIKVGYFSQQRELPEDATLIEYFCPNGGDIISVRGQNMHVYGYLKKFLFPKEQLGFKISALSGGERARIALAKLFCTDYELLILDEPTNDLDIATINILESYLNDYAGALIFVSHDRYFTDRLAHKLYAIEDGKISTEHMSFSELAELNSELSQIKDLLAADEISASASSAEGGTDGGAEGGASSCETNAKKRKSAKLTYREQQILLHHPEQISQIEKEISALNAKLSDARTPNSQLAELCALLDEANCTRERLENELLEVMLLEEELAISKS